MGSKKIKAKAVAVTGFELVAVPVSKVGHTVVKRPARYLKRMYDHNLQFEQQQAAVRAAKAQREAMEADIKANNHLQTTVMGG